MRTTRLALAALAIFAAAATPRLVAAQEPQRAVQGPPELDAADPRAKFAGALVERIVANDLEGAQAYLKANGEAAYVGGAGAGQLAEIVKTHGKDARIVGYRQGQEKDVIVEVEVAGELKPILVGLDAASAKKITGLRVLLLQRG